MGNIKNIIDRDDVSTSYYLFRPDTILKVIGEYTYIYNPVLKEWTDTKPFSDYVQSGTDFRAIKEDTVNKLIEELNDTILIKKEISDNDVKEMIAGKIKPSTENKEERHEDILPEIFEDEELPDIHLNSNEFYKNAFFLALVAIILLLGYIAIMSFKN